MSKELVNRIRAAVDVSNKDRDALNKVRMTVGNNTAINGGVELVITWGNGEGWRCCALTITPLDDWWVFRADGDVMDIKARFRDALSEQVFEDTGSLIEALLATSEEGMEVQ